VNKKQGLRVPLNFVATAPVYQAGERGDRVRTLFDSPQRSAFLELIDTPDLFLAHSTVAQHQAPMPLPYLFLQSLQLPSPQVRSLQEIVKNEEEIQLDLDDNDQGCEEHEAIDKKRRKIDGAMQEEQSLPQSTANEEEIELDLGEE